MVKPPSSDSWIPPCLPSSAPCIHAGPRRTSSYAAKLVQSCCSSGLICLHRVCSGKLHTHTLSALIFVVQEFKVRKLIVHWQMQWHCSKIKSGGDVVCSVVKLEYCVGHMVPCHACGGYFVASIRIATEHSSPDQRYKGMSMDCHNATTEEENIHSTQPQKYIVQPHMVSLRMCCLAPG